MFKQWGWEILLLNEQTEGISNIQMIASRLQEFLVPPKKRRLQGQKNFPGIESYIGLNDRN